MYRHNVCCSFVLKFSLNKKGRGASAKLLYAPVTLLSVLNNYSGCSFDTYTLSRQHHLARCREVSTDQRVLQHACRQVFAIQLNLVHSTSVLALENFEHAASEVKQKNKWF